MAYPVKSFTKTAYNASKFIFYQNLDMNKIYYMPDISDEAKNYWTINGLNIVTNEVVLPLVDYQIKTGYRLFITERENNNIYKYHIHVMNTENDLILNMDVDASDYGVNKLRFVTSAYILPITVPNKPTGLFATVLSKSSISLSWTDNSSDEASFIIQRSLDGTVWTQVGTVDENVTTYVDKGLNPSTTYQYRVLAINAYGNSGPSTKKTATTLPDIPAAPSNLLIQVISQTQVQLSWTDNAVNENGYVVQISLDETTWTTIATLATPNVSSYTNTGLTAGTKYFYKVYAYNTGGNSAYITESATTLPSIPVAPSALNATASGLNITLNWSDNANNETGYKIERSLYGSKTFQQIATVLSNIVTYEDADLPSGTEYEYRVRAYNIAGNSAYSNTIQITTMNAPNAPTSLVGEAVSETRIDIAWTDNSSDETMFKIERSDDAGATWIEIATTLANEVSYKDYSVTTGITYSYRVRSYNIIGNSDYSNTISLKPLSIPLAPSNLIATSISDTQINISWTDNSNDEVGFKLERSLNGINSWGTIYTAAPNETSYNHTGLTHSTDYYYRIRGYNDIGITEYSNVAYATTKLQAPSGLTGIASGLDINLFWNYDIASQNGFKIERTVYGSKVWSEIATVAAQTMLYADLGLSSATRYEYRIRAYNAEGTSEYSNILDITTFDVQVPNPPSEFVGLVETANAYIGLMWSEVADVNGYILEKSNDGEITWELLSNMASYEYSYKDYNAIPGVSYSYRIKSYNELGAGDYSIVLTFSLPGVPEVPSNLMAIAVDSTSIDISWTDNSSDENGFKLQRTQNPNNSSSWVTIRTAGPGETSYSDTGLNSSTMYYYRIFAYNDIGTSSYSDIADATTFLSAPINLIATVPSTDFIRLDWTDTAGTTLGFKLERKLTTESKDWTEIVVRTANKPYFEDNNIIIGLSYDYRVRAYDAAGSSDYSNIATQSIQ